MSDDRKRLCKFWRRQDFYIEGELPIFLWTPTGTEMFTAGIERIEGAKRWLLTAKFYSCGNTILGMDTALWTITDVLDIAAAEKVAKELGYPWNENADEDIYC